ncbi:uncharacterized protein LOC133814207 [Humulus lupulus]|uniref:uncharacterized protein LOC133814207 n=1 Tax=Humulus lupulus TaxID=3486 RepID=UPI002B409D49|nr:uncharacterized protein LOC133814207 [Humulus lupulus]
MFMAKPKHIFTMCPVLHFQYHTNIFYNFSRIKGIAESALQKDITLAVEGLLGVVFTVAALTDEAMDVGELQSPRCDSDPPIIKSTGKTTHLCLSMVDSFWLTILDALSLILSRSQGEAIVLEILKGYQAFTQVIIVLTCHLSIGSWCGIIFCKCLFAIKKIYNFNIKLSVIFSELVFVRTNFVTEKGVEKLNLQVVIFEYVLLLCVTRTK